MKNKTINLNTVQVPDLWKIAQIEELSGYTLGGKTARELIIETWHLAHDLLRHAKQTAINPERIIIPDP